MAKAKGSTWGPPTPLSPHLEEWRADGDPQRRGARTTPSVVALSKTGEVLVGEVASGRR